MTVQQRYHFIVLYKSSVHKSFEKLQKNTLQQFYKKNEYLLTHLHRDTVKKLEVVTFTSV